MRGFSRILSRVEATREALALDMKVFDL